MIGMLSSSSGRENEEGAVGCFEDRARGRRPVFGNSNHQKAPAAPNPGNAAGQVGAILRDNFDYFSGYRGFTFAIPREVPTAHVAWFASPRSKFAIKAARTSGCSLVVR